ncbi:hypothetical protein TNCV_3033711 [Trichonephila clavipes]|nr:hypothetical protein TNCV_3033711 [Trichonephila clavipes]
MSIVRSLSACDIAIKRNIQCQEDMLVDVLGLQQLTRTVISVCQCGAIDRDQPVSFFGLCSVIRNRNIQTACKQLPERPSVLLTLTSSLKKLGYSGLSGSHQLSIAAMVQYIVH